MGASEDFDREMYHTFGKSDKKGWKQYKKSNPKRSPFYWHRVQRKRHRRKKGWFSF